LDVDGVLLELIELDHLITKKKIEEVQPFALSFSILLTVSASFRYSQGEDIKDFINPNSRKTSFAIGEPALRNVQHGSIIQLERKGFFRVDKSFVRVGQARLSLLRSSSR
jgi:glutamyl-tRNA synthetase